MKNKKAVFGLTAVQQFFAVILGIALLAYVIVIIMGTLSTSSIISPLSGSSTENLVSINDSGRTLTQSTLAGFNGATITSIINGTSGATIPVANATIVNNKIYNGTALLYNAKDLNVTYSYTYDSNALMNSKSILGNTSSGVTSFFSAINPVYAILAVLVIILVLVVLVRVVQSPNSQKPQI